MRKNNSVRVCPLASGSKGNSLFIECGDQGILVDAGLSGVEIQRRLSAVGVDPENLTNIIITHEHSDHVKGAGVLSRRFDIPVHMTQKTFQACSGLGKLKNISFFECGITFNLDEIRISPFSISHDAKDPAGVTLEYNGHKIGVATDLGIATNLVKTHLYNCSVLYIESNHDVEMLMNGPYPWHLKQRIKSRVGHLSNKETKELVSELKTERLQHVILAHLSEENNHPEKAAFEVSQSLNGSGAGLQVARPDQPGQMISL